MPTELRKTVVIIGMMGAGKTAVGSALARRLGVRFVDTDAEIELAANMTIEEIFDRDGEAFFRLKEGQVLDRLLEGDPCVLSTGGGAWLAAENRRIVAAHGVSVWLRARLGLLWQRVRHKDSRPLLRTPDPKGTLRTLYEARNPVYAKADLTVDAEAGYSIEETAERVRQALLTRTDVLAEVDHGN